MVGIKRFNEIIEIGTFSQGLQAQEKKLLIDTIVKNQKNDSLGIIRIEPGICMELTFRSIESGCLNETAFVSFRFDLRWEECTWDRLVLNNTSVNKGLKLTNLDKILWEDPLIPKEALIAYLIQVSTYMLPFLEQRLLTTIRYPNGIKGESFYQKNCPDYAPDFIRKVEREGIQFIVCEDLSTLVWLGNQSAIEYHVPFQRFDEDRPLEIVFDLDPPDRSKFDLAVKAASEMKKIFDGFDITSFPKLSGSKGIQIHIPISDSRFTYSETKLFTSFISDYLVKQFPDDFTIERLKKNRGGRLYIDYVQHAEGKTIICPYSTRGKEDATVAAPLFWDEVNEDLNLETFNIPFVLNRIAYSGCPMEHFFTQENPSLTGIISKLKENR